MNEIFADRMSDVPRSFIREILKVTLDPEVISFAGGLPNREYFPVEGLKRAACSVFDIHGRDVLQYGSSEGDLSLRKFISQRYRSRKGIDVPPENILITNGSQQGLDLLGKVMLNAGDGLIIEEPGYLGAIQAFSMFKPRFVPVLMDTDGMILESLISEVDKATEAGGTPPKLMYTVPNFQNPSGITYARGIREKIAEYIGTTDILLVEDDPYGELRFAGEDIPSFRKFLPDQSVLLGSFSKTVVPGFRLGWIAAPDAVLEKLLIAKQAADLHSSHFTQRIIAEFLGANDIDEHIAIIKDIYGRQCRAMLDSIAEHFPEEVRYTRPEGGMFLWAELPEGLNALELFEAAARENVVFVPGDPFYIGKTGVNTLRLNFSCVDEETIEVGIQRLGKAIKRMLPAGTPTPAV
ncbi:MAG: PLP-dependent aminotransferase family protein [Spirochaetia bacterium]